MKRFYSVLLKIKVRLETHTETLLINELVYAKTVEIAESIALRRNPKCDGIKAVARA